MAGSPSCARSAVRVLIPLDCITGKVDTCSPGKLRLEDELPEMAVQLQQGRSARDQDSTGLAQHFLDQEYLNSAAGYDKVVAAPLPTSQPHTTR